MEILLFILMIAVVIIIILAVINYLGERNRKKIEEICSSLNLQNNTKSYSINASGIKLDGNFDNYRISIFQEVKGSGKQRTIYTVTRLILNSPSPFHLVLKPELGSNISEIPYFGEYLQGLRESIKEGLKIQDIHVNNKEFDETFLISGGPENMILDLLDHSLRNEILNFIKTGTGKLNKSINLNYSISITDYNIDFRTASICPEYPELKKILDLLCTLAIRTEDF